MSNDDNIQLVYDKQCPVCDLYCQWIDVRDAEGRLIRVNAREQSDVMDEISALGLDIDEGMVLKAGNELYYGSEAIHQLALLSSGKGFFNKLARMTFRSRGVAKALYPLLKATRNLLLKILRRSRINNLETPGNNSF